MDTLLKQTMEEQIAFYEHKLNYEIDSWDLYDAIGRGERIRVIDARSREAFAKEHIPDALSLPHREMSEASTMEFEKDTLYVIYCDGIGCNASTKGALKMAKLGFRVKELMGGLEWWKRDGYQTGGEKGQSGKPVECGC